MNQSFEALKRSILAMLQPDFKGPLDLVTSYSQKLAGDLNGVQTDEDLVSSLHVIQESSERLTRLVEDFISMAEFRTGEAEAAFRMRAVPEKNVGMIFYEAAYALQLDAELAEVVFSYDLNHNLPPVLCDRERLLDVFKRLVNFFVSARDSEAQSVHLHLSASDFDDAARLSLSVGGVHLSPEWLAELSSFLADAEGSIATMADVGPTWTVINNIIMLHEGSLSLKRLDDGRFELQILFPARHSEEATLTA